MRLRFKDNMPEFAFIALAIVLVLAGTMQGCASDGDPRPKPSPSQITDAIIIGVEGALESAQGVVLIWESSPGSGEEAIENIRKVRATIQLLGGQVKTSLRILETLGYIPTTEQQARIDAAVEGLAGVEQKVGITATIAVQ